MAHSVAWIPSLIGLLAVIVHHSSACRITAPLTLAENTRIGTVIGKIKYIDTTPINFNFTQMSSPYFHVNTTTSDITVTGDLDYETKPEIEILLLCLFNPESTSTSTISQKIYLTDINDNPPEFLMKNYIISVSEMTSVGDVLIPDSELSATDNDSYTLLTYEIAASAYSNYFNISTSPERGIALARRLDYETMPSINITYVAKDEGGNGGPFSGSVIVTINVLDQDDMNPRFSSQFYSASISPSTPVGGAVAPLMNIRADDQDFNLNAQIIYTINEESDTFNIDRVSGRVTLAKRVVSGHLYTAFLTATQVDNRDRSANALLKVQVSGGPSQRNSSVPMFLTDHYNVSVLENSPIHYFIAMITANDQDFKSPLSYTLADSSGLLSLSNRGALTVQDQLDFETESSYIIAVEATDGRDTATATVTVHVLDVNDIPPSITGPLARTVNPARKKGETIAIIEFVQESIDHNTDKVWRSLDKKGQGIAKTGVIHWRTWLESDPSVGCVKRYDRYEASVKDPASSITFSLLGGRGLFNINGSGEIYIAQDPENITQLQYDIVAVITDSGNPRQTSLVAVAVQFDPAGVTGEATMVEQDNTLAIVFGVLFAIMVVAVICLAVFIIRRMKYKEELDRVKPPPKVDPQGLAYKSTKSSKASTKASSGNVDLEFNGNLDETSDGGATSVQENPIHVAQVNEGFYGSDESLATQDSRNDYHNDIQIETAVTPYVTDGFSSFSGGTSHTKTKIVNGGLKTFQPDNDSSMESINSDMLPDSSTQNLAKSENRNGTANKQKWDYGNVNGFGEPVLDPETAVAPMEDRPEITVYF